MSFDKIRIIFFDLDNTLFDHRRAERTALITVLENRPGLFATVAQEAFLSAYDEINTRLWKRMAEGDISSQKLKIARFELTLQRFGLATSPAEEISQEYLNIYTQQNFTVPNVREILDYLRSDYELGVLSNGFSAIQDTKLALTNLGPYFQYKIYSGDVGAMKPAAKIFMEAMRISNANAEEIAYVGDSYESDILGAKAVDWQAILFDPSGNNLDAELPYLKIANLLELKEVF